MVNRVLGIVVTISTAIEASVLRVAALPKPVEAWLGSFSISS